MVSKSKYSTNQLIHLYLVNNNKLTFYDIYVLANFSKDYDLVV